MSGSKRWSSELSLEHNVHFEGPISPVHKAYHAADVVVLSSISEGFPYTPIEAMMCGKPVVATRVGGVGEAMAARASSSSRVSRRSWGGP